MPAHRLLADEQFPARVTARLRACGHDVVTVQKYNASKYGDGKSDPQVLRIAVAEQRAVITLNRKDFQSLHDKSSGHFGIIICFRDDKNPDALGRRIDDAIRPLPRLNAQLIRVAPPVSEELRRKANRRTRRRR